MAEGPVTRLKIIYYLCLFLRLTIALTCTGYIHPDEFFQTVVASERGRQDLTWDWSSDKPIRSFGPILLVFKGPTTILKALGIDVQGVWLYRTHRLIVFVLSLVSDYAVGHLSNNPFLARLLLATAPSTLTFSLHTFSNSIEAAVLACVFLAFVETSSRRGAALLGILVSYGIFLRVSFLFFVLPVGASLLTRPRSLLLSGLAFCTSSIAWLVVDRAYYGRFVLSPYNLLRYNLNAENIASHGRHPRWLHLVNLNIVVGPALVAIFVVSSTKQHIWQDDIHFWIIVTAFSLFSSQIHQEARFLQPLLVPIVIISSRIKLSRKLWRFFWTTQCTVMIISIIFFEIFHQAGVMPTLFNIGKIRNFDVSDVICWNALMAPEHLHSFHVTNLGGASPETVYHLLASSEKLAEKNGSLILVAPRARLNAIADWTTLNALNVELIFSHWPHLDTDHLEWIWQGGFDQGLRLDTYRISAPLE